MQLGLVLVAIASCCPMARTYVVIRIKLRITMHSAFSSDKYIIHIVKVNHVDVFIHIMYIVDMIKFDL